MAEIPEKSVKKYPDVSHLLELKEKRRTEKANLSFAEKIEAVKRLNEAAKLWKNSKIIEKTG
jgi:hypothetical protein